MRLDSGRSFSMPKILRRSLVTAVLALPLASPVSAEVMVKDAPDGTVVGLSGLILSSPEMCQPFTFSGRVVKREFGDDVMTVSGFTVEEADGTRTHLNVDDPSSLGMPTRAVVGQGLQRLTKVGQSVEGRALACGAAGRVSVVDRLTLSRATVSADDHPNCRYWHGGVLSGRQCITHLPKTRCVARASDGYTFEATSRDAQGRFCEHGGTCQAAEIVTRCDVARELYRVD